MVYKCCFLRGGDEKKYKSWSNYTFMSLDCEIDESIDILFHGTSYHDKLLFDGFKLHRVIEEIPGLSGAVMFYEYLKNNGTIKSYAMIPGELVSEVIADKPKDRGYYAFYVRE